MRADEEFKSGARSNWTKIRVVEISGCIYDILSLKMEEKSTATCEYTTCARNDHQIGR
jgi:hypothetical protein